MNKELQDHVWKHCLPKEFKEEVKKMYNGHILNDLDYGRNSALINLFGENLTSDAEGEDEMLTVSRNRLMDAFNSAKIIATSKMSSKILAGAADMCIKTFEDVFGSKCLPDNVATSESNVDSLDGSVESLEPTPAEPKFHVRQKVKFKGKDYSLEIAAIEKWDDCNEYQYKLAGWKHSYRESDLEPYTEPTETFTDTCQSQCKSQEESDRDLCDKLIQRGFKNHNRLTIAARMMQGLICAPLVPGVDPNPPTEQLAQTAFRLADALIAEAEKGGDK